MRVPDPAFEAWVADARAADFSAAADLCGFRPARGQERGTDRAGPCPACGGRDRFAVNFARRKFNCRGCGAKGADALALALVGERVSFVEACEALTGQARPARIGAETPEARAAREARLAEARARRDAEGARSRASENAFRGREIEAARRIWDAGEAPFGGVVAYLAARGVALPAGADLRFGPDIAYFHGTEHDEAGRVVPRVLHRGPAMLAAIRDMSGARIGVHITYMTEDCRAKAAIADPETGEVLVAKKVRGSKRGGHIVLRPGGDAPRRLFLGEGIETVLSVACALRAAGALRPDDAFWTAVDLGNLGGGAVASVPHPTARTERGRPVMVPGPQPDLDAPGISIPASITELILLGDGDSEPFLTSMAMERAQRRYARDGLAIGVAMAPPGADFNDLWRSAA